MKQKISDISELLVSIIVISLRQLEDTQTYSYIESFQSI